jgi:hypothetical protein
MGMEPKCAEDGCWTSEAELPDDVTSLLALVARDTSHAQSRRGVEPPTTISSAAPAT